MSGARELEALAERYLDLWERQLAAMTDAAAERDRFEPLLRAFAEAALGAGGGAAPPIAPTVPDDADG